MLLWLLIAVALDKAQLIIAAPGYGSRYCGIGTTDDVLARRAAAPMAYRVLVPWLLGIIERIRPSTREHRLSIYEAIKILIMALCLWSVSVAIDFRAALIVAALLPMTFSFDYWDWAVELGALAMALGGDLQGSIIGGIALALSRETAPLVPLTYLIVTGDWSGAFVAGIATALTMTGVRLWAGEHKLYCDRFMWKRNVAELRQMFTCSPWYSSNVALSALISGLVVVLAVTGHIGATWPVPLVLLALGWTMGIAYETRIFASCLLWIATGLIR